MVNRVIYYEATGAAGIKDGMISVLSTGMVEVWSGKCSCVKRGPEDGFTLAICSLMDYSIIDVEVPNILGDAWSLVCTDKGKRVVASVTRVVAHPLATWVISVPLLGLRGSMSYPC